mgnify:FL=1
MGKVLNESSTPIADEEEYSFPTPSPFQTDLPPTPPKHPSTKAEGSGSRSRKSSDPNRYKGHSLMKRILEQEEMESPKKPLSQVSEEHLEETGRNPGRSSREDMIGVDYKQIWCQTNVATVVADLFTGKLFKGNRFFMEWDRWRSVTIRLFHFSKTEEINALRLFDLVVVDDLSILWR